MEGTSSFKRLLNAVLQVARDPRPRLDWIMGAALGLAALLLYLSARNVFYGFDALLYAEAVERGSAERLLHPHHLLYNPLCRVAYDLGRLLGYGGRALTPMHVVNALAGGAGVFLIFTLCRRLGAGRLASLGAGAALATAAAYWSTAAGVATHLPGMAMALAALYAAAVTRASAVRAAVAGAVCAGAALFDQINLLLAPPVAAYLFFSGPAPRRRLTGFAVAYAAAFAVGYVFVPVTFLKMAALAAYVDWFFYYARLDRWGILSVGNVLPGADAFARVFYVNAFWDNATAPFVEGDLRHLRVALPLWLAVVICGWNLLLWFGRGPGRRALILLGPTFFLYACFTLWWVSDYIDLWLVPAGCLLVAVALAVSNRRQGRGISFLALSLAWLGIVNVNWRDGIEPRTELRANADYRAAATLAATVPRNALTYLAPTPVLTYARYFNGMTKARTPNWALSESDGDSEEAARRLEALMRGEWDCGRRIYVGDRAFPGLGGPPFRALGERLLRRGRPVGSYAGAVISETIYAVPPDAAGD
ncbi:MAG: hypothetical protein JSU81_03505 [Candidatus Coatesbacteria bacterium]|nr:MAG: hypothetical protein JSU81_03505 [Candidatus Coatesbacteria bacterium]